jgi:dihydrofolate synthase/folylpolyglutamate synthase
VSVITSVGLDHMETLGATIPEIAWHKAGIIKSGVPAVSAVTDRDAIAVIDREASAMGSPLIPVIAGETFEYESADNGHFLWRTMDCPNELYPTAMRGRFQAVNAATALAAIRALPTGFATVTPEVVRAGLSRARLQGRYEVMQSSPTIVLDGAHNPEKMRALARDLRAWRMDHPESRLIAVVGMLESKDHRPMLAEVSRIADELVVTSPQVLAKPGAEAAALARAASETGFNGPTTAVEVPAAALDRGIEHADVDDLVLVTGSLYLVGNVRGRWYPDDEIVIQQTPWPEVKESS